MTPPDPTPTASSSTSLLDRREYLRLTGGLAAGAAAGLAGCTGDDVLGGGDDGGSDGASATGLLATAVSDQPGDIGDFESCVVTIDGVWIGPRSDGEAGDEGEEDGDAETDDEDETDDEREDDESDDETETSEESTSDDDAAGSQPDDEEDGDGPPGDADEQDGDDEDGDEAGDDADEDESGDDGDDGEDGDDGAEDDGEDGGRTYLEFDEPQEADLVQLQGEASQLVGEHELAVGTYQYLQLDVAGVEGVLEDGGEADVETPGNAPLQFQESFDVREGYRTTFLADFTPVRRGNGSYVFQPVASETEVSYEELDGEGGSDDGADGDSDGGDEDDGGDAEDTSTDDGGSSTGGNEST